MAVAVISCDHIVLWGHFKANSLRVFPRIRSMHVGMHDRFVVDSNMDRSDCVHAVLGALQKEENTKW